MELKLIMNVLTEGPDNSEHIGRWWAWINNGLFDNYTGVGATEEDALQNLVHDLTEEGFKVEI